ncbi:thioredoxin-like domain-containing protein [Alistipes sp. ZOR0009]|uniref:thioredoxin-like domain-containing protein n=1 Tax=Alistipes sp. ZOR0009 TaxID=1339253 RepID=UPI00068F5EB1|nr:thioredoxin-like domain-containing protein [Alistipes sp. ZOR0009]
MRKNALTVLICLVAIGLNALAQKGTTPKANKGKHLIEIKINGLKDTTLMLGYHFGASKYVLDTVKVNSSGVALIQGDSLLAKGIYIAILPDKTNFDFLIDKDQIFSIETSKNNLWENLKFKNSPINSNFIAYQHFMKTKQEQVTAIQKQMKADSTNKELQKQLQEKLKTVDQEVKDVWKTTREKENGNLLSTLIALVETPSIPEFNIPAGAANPDSIRWVMGYTYQKNHYWDNINLSDEGILRTPIFESRLKGFFTNILIQTPDSLNMEVDRFIAKTEGNKNTYQYVVSYLLNHFNQSNIMSHDAVFVHIAENYYINKKAPWANEELMTKLKERVNRLRPNLVGKIAPNLVLESDNGEYIALNQIKAKYTIVYFWEPDCSHCQKETPILYNFYNKVRDKGIQVYAIYTQYKKEEWQKSLAEKGYDWINVWDANYNSNFRALYDITSTPTVFLLDKDKKIIAKKISVETLEQIVNDLLSK